MVSTCLGTPPKEFTFEYYDKDKKYKKIGPVSPLDFYREHVKPHFNVDDKVRIATNSNLFFVFVCCIVNKPSAHINSKITESPPACTQEL